MGLQAEWDPVAQVAIAFLDDTDLFRPRQPTGATLSPGVSAVILNVRSTYPDPYLPTLPELLGPAVLRWDASSNVLVREWPAAAYTPDRVRAGLLAIVKQNARFALADTDWMIVRQIETEEPIPSDVAAFRSSVRAWSKEREAKLASASAAELLTFDTAAPRPKTTAPAS